MLFASTVINYVDRQTLSLLAPDLKRTYHWTNTDYASLVIAFRVAYAIGQTSCGRLMDRVGARTGLTFTVACYSLVSVLTAFANGFAGFLSFRFFLGLAESGNWPGATKVVSEWFPKHERGLATAFFDSGSSIGGAIAPFLVLMVYARWGLHASFIIPGLLGFVWLIFWRMVYRREPATAEIRSDPPEVPAVAARSLRDLLRLPETWGVIVARSFTDPVWFFIADWFPIYLVSKGIPLRSGLIAVWIPFLAADLGNFFGGALSGLLIRKGWSLLDARKALVILGGVGVLTIIPTVFTTRVSVIALLFATATFSYGCFTTIANVLPSDLFPSTSVASVSGLSGTAASAGTIIAFLLIGSLSDARLGEASHMFDPIVIVAGTIPFVGMLLVLVLLRNRSRPSRARYRIA